MPNITVSTDVHNLLSSHNASQVRDSIGLSPVSLTKNWYNKKFTSYGDSITAQQKWQSPVVSHFGLVHTNLGVGGRKVSGTLGMNTSTNIDNIGTDCDLLIVMGGVNDWSSNVALGPSNSTNTDEFYGALNVMANRLTTRLPNSRIIFGTPTYSELANGQWQIRVPSWTSASVNGIGLTTHDYAEATRTVAKKYGFPVMDTAALDGINDVNIDDYRKDDGNHIHHNTAGGERTAETCIGLLSSVAPLS